MSFPRLAFAPAVAAALALLASGCAVVDPHNLIGRRMGESTPASTDLVATPSGLTLSPAARTRAFDFVWETVRDQYYDPNLNGADWSAAGEKYRPLAMAARNDDAFWDALDRMTGELRDSHTRVESPKRVALRERDEAVTLGFSFVKIGDKLVVSYVAGDADAWWAGVRPGMTLASIAGEPALAAYERAVAEARTDSTERSRQYRAVRRIIGGDPGTKVDLVFERADGTRIDTILEREKQRFPPEEGHRVLPSGYGYIRFSQWTLYMGYHAIEAVKRLKNTPGLIIDLRGNPGGAAEAVNMMLQRFFPHRTELGRVITRDGNPVSLFAVPIIKLERFADGERDAYTGPVVILVSAGSASASELFASTMQAVGRAKVVGQQSCGCLLGFLGYAIVPGGAELAFSEVAFETAKGKRIEGEGVMPDRVVPITAADLAVSRDRALEEAQALLATMKPWDK